MDTTTKGILVSGATGYVGSRLAKALSGKNYYVRLMARRIDYESTKFFKNAEWVKADALDKDSLKKALKGMDTAFYLIHSMASGSKFSEIEETAAKNFANAAHSMGVKRIIYLSGLGEDTKNLSLHLKSRHKTGEILRSSGINTLEFRASVIIGPGSLSFEIIRNLVERLPIMITPKWVHVKTQPIYIKDVINYLMQAIELKTNENHIFEIGGKDVLSYGDLMKAYAEMRNLKRILIPIPLLTPKLSSLWLQLVTPVYARVGRKLIESLSYKTVVHDKTATKVFNVETTSIKKALNYSLKEEETEYKNIRWSHADTYVSYGKLYPNVFTYGHRLIDKKIIYSTAKAPDIFHEIITLGGEKGWYYANWLWKIRGFIDLCVGGIGLRRGRRSPSSLHVGDTIDFFRVQKLVENKLLLLYAEMRVPGKAWLQFEINEGPDKTQICQTAIFEPRGLFGLVYWYSLFPFHNFIFKGLLKAIKKRAEMKN